MTPDVFWEDIANVELGEVSVEQAIASRLTVWLADTLSAERRACAISLERRHSAIVAELESQVRSQLNVGPTFPPLAPFPTNSCGPQAQEPSKGLTVTIDGGSTDSPPQLDSVQNIDDGHPPRGSLRSVVKLEKSLSNIGCMEVFVRSSCFDYFFMIVVLLNMVAMIAERQYEGTLLNDLIGFDKWMAGSAGGAEQSAEEEEGGSVSGIRSLFFALDVLVGVLFWLEMLAKCAVLRHGYYKEMMNLFDIAVNVLWLLDLSGVNIGVQPSTLRMFRLARVTRLAKVLMLADRFGIFDSLRLLMVCIWSSVPIFMWSMFFLLSIIVFCALLLSSVFSSILLDEAMPLQHRQELFRKFGTFSRATLTMCELTFASFMPVTDLLVMRLSEWWFVPVVVYKGVVGFGIIKVITGVFMKETFRAADTNDGLMVLQKERSVKLHTRKMSEFFMNIDEAGDGTVSREEFDKVLQDDWVRTWFASMELDVKDVKLVFELLDRENDGSLTLEEVIKGIGHLKGAARSMDLQEVRLANQRMEKQLHSVARTVTEMQLASARDLARHVAFAAAPQLSGAKEWPTRASSPATSRCASHEQQAATWSRISAGTRPPHEQIIHRGDAFIGTCTEGVPDERLMCKANL